MDKALEIELASVGADGTMGEETKGAVEHKA